MTAILLPLLLKFWPIIAGALGVLGWGIAQRRSGARNERARQAAAEAKARTIADEIDDAVAGRTADENRGRLKQWQKR
jgi:hypothetical protein